MTVRGEVSKAEVAQLTEKGQAIGGTGFDWVVVALGTWLMVGGYSDGWAHNHLPIDNFFTPWHAAFYSGFLASMIFLSATFIRNRIRGYSWQKAMPAGYELSLLGALIILFGGVGDMIWHILFGIELSIDGALSPTHIAVAIGLALVVSGPFRAAWQRSNVGSRPGFLSLLPMLLSLTFTLSTITIISQFAHPFVYTSASDPDQTFASRGLAVASIVLQTVILMGLVLVTMRRWTLPFGALTLVFTLNIIFLSFMRDHYLLITVAALAGLIADLFIRFLKPSTARPSELRLFAFVVPTVLYLLYFLALTLTTGVNWTIHLWLGSTVVAGVTGFLLSYLLVPPKVPSERVE